MKSSSDQSTTSEHTGGFLPNPLMTPGATFWGILQIIFVLFAFAFSISVAIASQTNNGLSSFTVSWHALTTLIDESANYVGWTAPALFAVVIGIAALSGTDPASGSSTLFAPLCLLAIAISAYLACWAALIVLFWTYGVAFGQNQPDSALWGLPPITIVAIVISLQIGRINFTSTRARLAKLQESEVRRENELAYLVGLLDEGLSRQPAARPSWAQRSGASTAASIVAPTLLGIAFVGTNTLSPSQAIAGSIFASIFWTIGSTAVASLRQCLLERKIAKTLNQDTLAKIYLAVSFLIAVCIFAVASVLVVAFRLLTSPFWAAALVALIFLASAFFIPARSSARIVAIQQRRFETEETLGKLRKEQSRLRALLPVAIDPPETSRTIVIHFRWPRHKARN